ncbi:MAG: hypothetical protein ACPLTR_10545 [Thermacetogeniaceae bacterium]
MLQRLKPSPFAGTPLEGLESCLPKFKHRDILLYDGRTRTGGGGSRRRQRHGSPLQRKLEMWRRSRYGV